MDSLEEITNLLDKYGGHYVYGDYVIVSQKEFEKTKEQGKDRQLNLLAGAKAVLAEAKKAPAFADSFVADEEEAPSSEEILQHINKDIALWRLQQETEREEEAVADLAEEDEEDDLSIDFVGKKVRFEAIKGDLSPDLQE